MRTRQKYHYVSVQVLDGSILDESRAIQRVWSYKYKNIKCHIQEVGKGDAELIYGIKVSEVMYILYLQNPIFIPDETTRYIIKDDPRRKIEGVEPEEGLKILEFRGKKEPVIHHISRYREVEIYTEFNKRWKI